MSDPSRVIALFNKTPRHVNCADYAQCLSWAHLIFVQTVVPKYALELHTHVWDRCSTPWHEICSRAAAMRVRASCVISTVLVGVLVLSCASPPADERRVAHVGDTPRSVPE